MLFQLIDSCRRDRKVISANKDMDFAPVLSEEKCFLHGCIPTANNKDVLSGEELPITCRTISDTMPTEFFFAGKSGKTGMRTGCIDDTHRLKISSIGMYHLCICSKRQALYFCRQKFCTEGFSLTHHFSGQRFPVRLVNAGVIHHFRCDRDLSAHLLFFDDKDMKTCSCHINSGGEPCRSSAYYNGIISFFHDAAPFYNFPTRSKDGFSVFAPGCHLAGQTSSPCSYTN